MLSKKDNYQIDKLLVRTGVVAAGRGMHIYSDHYVLIGIDKARFAGDLGGWHAMLSKLKKLPAWPVFSVWHMMKNANVCNGQERCTTISWLRPRFFSNDIYVKGRELVSYFF